MEIAASKEEQLWDSILWTFICALLSQWPNKNIFKKKKIFKVNETRHLTSVQQFRITRFSTTKSNKLSTQLIEFILVGPRFWTLLICCNLQTTEMKFIITSQMEKKKIQIAKYPANCQHGNIKITIWKWQKTHHRSISRSTKTNRITWITETAASIL